MARNILRLEGEGILVEMWKENNRYHAKINRQNTKALSDNRDDAIEQTIALFEALLHQKQMVQKPKHSQPNRA